MHRVSIRSMRHLLRQALVAAACVLTTSLADASGLQVSPVSLTLPATQNAEGLWLSNTGDTVVHAQVRVYRWTQDERGDQLTPTRELLVSPPMLELAAGERQLIRAIRLGAPSTTGIEQTYRLVIDELPVAQPEEQGLRYVLRYSVPVFVQPAGPEPGSPELQWTLRREQGQAVVEVENRGATHAQLVNLVHADTQGRRTELAPGLLGYVLPGARMRWTLEKIPPAALDGTGDWIATINGKSEQGIQVATPDR